MLGKGSHIVTLASRKPVEMLQVTYSMLAKIVAITIISLLSPPFTRVVCHYLFHII